MIGISLLTLVPGEIGGAETAARGLVAGLAEVGTLEYTAFTPPAAPGAGGGLPEVAVPEYRLARTVPQRALAMALAAARPAPLRTRFGPLDAIHYPLTIAVPRLDAPSAVTVYDLQHLDLPQLFTRAERLFRARMHEGSARRADAVIVTSQFVRRSVVERLGVPPERVHAIPLGLDHERLRPGEEHREPFLLYPARPWPHKNHERLFEAFALLRRERPELELVLTGGGHEARPVPPASSSRVSSRATSSCRSTSAPPASSSPACTRASASPRWRQWPVAARSQHRISRRSPRPAETPRRSSTRTSPRTSPPSSPACSMRRSASPPPGSSGAAAFTWAETARRHEAVYRTLA